MATGVKKGRSVFAPAGLVEVDGEEEAGFVPKQRVDAGDEGLSLGVATRQVPANDVVSDRKEPTVGTFSAFDARLLADATNPLVGTGGRVTGSARFSALKSPGVHVVAASEQRPEQGDLRFGRRRPIDRAIKRGHSDSNMRRATALLRDAREQRVPRRMLLLAIGTRARKSTLKDAQLMHLRDREPFPTVRRSTSASAAELVAEKVFDATSDAVVVWLHGSRSSNFVHELDETLLSDRADQLWIGSLTPTDWTFSGLEYLRFNGRRRGEGRFETDGEG